VSNFEDYITIQHIELMNIVIMITGSIVGVAYITELFIAWYSGVECEQYAFLNRATGPYWWAYWLMMTCNVFSPQFMWFKKLRRSIMFSFVISIVVNIGMWFERFVIIATSLHRDYMPSAWTMMSPTFVDIGIFIGTIGFFFVLFLLYARTFPVISQAGIKSILKESGDRYKRIRSEQGDDANHFAPVARSEEDIAPVFLSLSREQKIEKLLASVGAAEASTKDNLNLLTDMEDGMSDRLNAIGIYNYEQLSRLTEEDYDLLDSILDVPFGTTSIFGWD